MKRNDIKALHDQTIEQLTAQIEEMEKEYVLNKMKHRSNQGNVKPGNFKIVRKDIARIKTIIHEKQLATKAS